LQFLQKILLLQYLQNHILGRMTMAYGERIKFYRVLRGMSQELLAEHTGITYTSISRIEHETRKVTLEEAIRFAEVLGISLQELAGLPEASACPEEIKRKVSQCVEKIREINHLANDLDRTVSLS
jgi:transcriptional regulator with XRE-family HTH domain